MRVLDELANIHPNIFRHPRHEYDGDDDDDGCDDGESKNRRNFTKISSSSWARPRAKTGIRQQPPFETTL